MPDLNNCTDGKKFADFISFTDFIDFTDCTVFTNFTECTDLVLSLAHLMSDYQSCFDKSNHGPRY